MIRKYELKLVASKNEYIKNDIAYPLYSFLLQHISNEYAQLLHEQGYSDISQYVDFFPSYIIWNISLFGEQSIQEFSSAINDLECIYIENYNIELKVYNINWYNISIQEIVDKVVQTDNIQWNTLKFISPTSFKTQGEYALYPTSELVLHSLISKWNFYNSNIILDDKDMLNLLYGGVNISGYTLNSITYKIKGKYIQSFVGSIKMHTKLSPPVMNIYKSLIAFSEYSGIGIKTALGMGGSQIIKCS